VIGVEVVADVGEHAAQPATGLFDFFRLARHAVHVGGRAAEVGNDAGKAGCLVANRFDFADHRIFGAALDDAAFVLGDRAERAAAKAAAHDIDREPDHLPRRNFGIAVAWVRRACVGQVVDRIHVGRGQRNWRWIQPYIALAVCLAHRARIAGVRFEMEYARGVGIKRRVVFNLIVIRQADHGARTQFLQRGHARALGNEPDRRRAFGRLRRRRTRRHGVGVDVCVNRTGGVELGRHHLDPICFGLPIGVGHESGAAHIADVGDRFTLGQTMGDFEQRAFGVTKNQHVGLGIRQHRAAHGIGPVVVMRDAAQAGLDRADDHGGAGVGFAATLRIHSDRAIRALVRRGVGRVGIVGADLAVRGVAVDHRIHVARRHTEIQRGLTQLTKRIGRQPVRLADDADAIALCFQQSSDQRHAEAGVVDVGIPRHQNDVARIPAERGHFGTRHGQERGGAEACRPVLAMRKQSWWSHEGFTRI